MLVRLRREMPRAPVRVSIEELRSRKLIDPWIRVCSTTVYRFLKAQGLWEGVRGCRRIGGVFRQSYPTTLAERYDVWSNGKSGRMPEEDISICLSR
jgi:hypothetical protein